MVQRSFWIKILTTTRWQCMCVSVFATVKNAVEEEPLSPMQALLQSDTEDFKGFIDLKLYLVELLACFYTMVF